MRSFLAGSESKGQRKASNKFFPHFEIENERKMLFLAFSNYDSFNMSLVIISYSTMTKDQISKELDRLPIVEFIQLLERKKELERQLKTLYMPENKEHNLLETAKH